MARCTTLSRRGSVISSCVSSLPAVPAPPPWDPSRRHVRQSTQQARGEPHAEVNNNNSERRHVRFPVPPPPSSPPTSSERTFLFSLPLTPDSYNVWFTTGVLIEGTLRKVLIAVGDVHHVAVSDVHHVAVSDVNHVAVTSWRQSGQCSCICQAPSMRHTEKA